MTKEDLSVTIVPVSLELTHLTINNEGIRPLNVVAVDTTLKTITVKYGGTYSGTYDLVIKSTLNGNIDTTATQLKAVFEITGFTPTSGSIFGGSKITVQGGPFTEDLDDTIIKVGTNWWDGFNQQCYILTTSENEVTCRLPLDLNRQAKEYELLAISSTYEEANCEFNDCLFTFIAATDLPEITAFETKFDSTSSEYQILIDGSGFSIDTTDRVDFLLD